jgi:RNA recognition motif-containing protein
MKPQRSLDIPIDVKLLNKLKQTKEHRKWTMPGFISSPEMIVSTNLGIFCLIDVFSCDLEIKVAQSIIFEKTLKIGQKKLHMILQKQHGDYNPDTSIYIGLINPFCNESDIIEELNLVLRDERIKKEKETSISRSKSAPANPDEKKDKEEKVEVKSEIGKNFILSCIVFYDPITSRPKQFAFVDFSTKEAAQICIKAWHTRSMKKFPNRLMVTAYDDQHHKMTKAEREKSKDAKKGPFTNLWVEKLPYAFQEKDVFELFSQYGTVASVKVKKPNTSNVRF